MHLKNTIFLDVGTAVRYEFLTGGAVKEYGKWPMEFSSGLMCTLRFKSIIRVPYRGNGYENQDFS